MAAATRTSGWQLTEGSATAYERYLVPVFLDAWAVDLLDGVQLAPGERVLDAACGTGIVARHAARRLGPDAAVTAVDVNPAMLAVAREAGAGLPIAWHETSLDRLPLGDAGVDVALCQQALQFLPDAPAALAELARVVRPGGRLGLSTCRGLEHQPGYRILTDVVRRHVGVPAAEALASPFVLGAAEEVAALLGQAGFADVHARIALWSPRFASAEALLFAETASSPLGELVSQLDADVAEALVAELATALAPHRDDDGIIFPFETLVVTATRRGPER